MTVLTPTEAQDAATQKAVEQAILRKERREAKIRAGGAARLSKITGVEPPRAQQPDLPTRRPAEDPAPAQYPDPEEVDISKVVPGDLALSPMQRLQALMQTSGASSGDNQLPSVAGLWSLPPPQPPRRPASVWALAHGALALGLGLYWAVATSYAGSRAERDYSAVGWGDETAVARQLFRVFAATEAVLLTVAMLLDDGVAGSAGWVRQIARSGLVPRWWQARLDVGLRYGRFFWTVRRDVLACVFVLGLCSWLRAG